MFSLPLGMIGFFITFSCMFSLNIANIFTANPSNQKKNLNETLALYKSVEPTDSIAGIYLLELLKLTEQEKNYQELGKLSIEFFHHPSPSIQSMALKKQVLKNAISHEDELDDWKMRGNLFLKLGGAYYTLEQYDSAIIEYTTAMDRFTGQDSILVADAYFFRGQAKSNIGDLLGGMQDFQHAKDIYGALGDEEYVQFVNGSMAILYSRFAIYKEAEEIRNSLIEYFKSKNDDVYTAVHIYNKAKDLEKQNRTAEQLDALLEANALIPDDAAYYYEASIIKLSLSMYYGDQGDFTKQQEYFTEVENILEKAPELKENNPLYLSAKSMLMYSNGDFLAANQLAKESLRTAKESEDMGHLISAYLLLSKTYNKIGQPQLAYQTHQQLKGYTDSIFAANQAASFSYYQTLYETEKKETEILTQTHEIESIKQKNLARLRIITIMVAILMVSAVLIFLWKNLMHQKKKKEMQSKFAHELLKSQELERGRISKDLHDGLGQSLLLIKNKVSLSKDTNTGELLDSAISELRAIARSLHPMQLEKLGLTKAVSNLLDQIDNETELFVSSEMDDLNELIGKQEELQLYRIIQESINNILKHSEASAMRVVLQARDNSIKLTIEDNGKGFDFSEKLNDFQSLGLKTIKERIAAIGGSMKVDSEKGKGTCLTFYLNV